MFKIIMEIIPDNKIFIVKSTHRVVSKCVCPEEKVTHEFYLLSSVFDVDSGLRISVKVN